MWKSDVLILSCLSANKRDVNSCCYLYISLIIFSPIHSRVLTSKEGWEFLYSCGTVGKKKKRISICDVFLLSNIYLPTSSLSTMLTNVKERPAKGVLTLLGRLSVPASVQREIVKPIRIGILQSIVRTPSILPSSAIRRAWLNLFLKLSYISLFLWVFLVKLWVHFSVGCDDRVKTIRSSPWVS